LISNQLAGVDSYLELKRREYGTLSDSEEEPSIPVPQAAEPMKIEKQESKEGYNQDLEHIQPPVPEEN
jgi:hypothetical protein